MGRGRGRGRGKRSFNRNDKSGGDNSWDANKKARTANWGDLVQENAAFEEYYKAQNVCPPEEWDAFMACLRRQLPLTFRINGGGKFADDLRAKLESDFFSDFASGPIIIDGEVINPPMALPWYPNKLGWQLEFSRTQLRKIPKLAALHEFMKRETDVGAITRQEAVSMVPPLFLDVRPPHRVLDMCAAPGSKTAQLLEALHTEGPTPSGVVVANDADAQRCNMLTHQTQRMRSPALVVCNHEAQMYPLLWDLDPSSSDRKIMFDRILCDVPCSGDGTIRKQPDIWRRWSPSNGNGLHMLQLRITLRACELLRVGGRLVYSTCTFNPIEDEAVVAEVLRRAGGSMELLDVNGELPELKRCAGLREWRVRDREGAWFSNWEEGKEGHKLDPSMFCGPADEGLPLERCMRFLPHHQDTGGFFVAVLQKVKELDGLQYPTVDHRVDPAKAAAAAKRAERKSEVVAAAAAAAAGGENGSAPMEEETKPAEETAAAAAPAPAVVEAPDNAPVEEVAAEEGDVPTEGEVAKRPPRAPPAKVLPEWGIRGGGSRNRAAEAAEAAATAAAAVTAGATETPAGEGAAAPDTEAAQDEKPPAAAAASKPAPNAGGGRWRGIDPIVPMTDASILDSIRSFYGLGPDCGIPNALIARSNDVRPKKLNYINSGAKLLLQMDVKEQIKVTAAGVKMFDRQDNRENILACAYRLAQEGLPSLLPYITKQRFQPTIQEMLYILKDRMVGLPTESKIHITKGNGATEGVEAQPEVQEEVKPIVEATDGGDGGAEVQAEGEGERGAKPATGAEPAGAGAAEAFKSKLRVALSDASTLEQLGHTEYGCCVATLRRSDLVALGLADSEQGVGAEAAEAMFAVACWRGRGNLNVLVSKQECSQIAERLEAAIAASGVATA